MAWDEHTRLRCGFDSRPGHWLYTLWVRRAPAGKQLILEQERYERSCSA